jgi:hypothetical protein
MILQGYWLQDLNPLLSEEACENLFQLCQVWQEHCVLLDTVTRCLQLLQSASSSSSVASADSARSSLTKVAAEMMNQRHWDPHAHPQWLALEVLQRITIRPRQYTVAKQLLENLGGPGLSEEERGAMLQVRPVLRTILYKQKR